MQQSRNENDTVANPPFYIRMYPFAFFAVLAEMLG